MTDQSASDPRLSVSRPSRIDNAAVERLESPAQAPEQTRKRFALKKTQPGETATAPIVPARSIAGTALMLVIAIMGCLACLAVGAVTIIDRAAGDWSSEIGREITIEVTTFDPSDIDSRLARAAQIARASPGIGQVRIIDAAETQALLEPWLGALATQTSLQDLPIPRLISLTVADRSLLDLDDLQATLQAEVPGAAIDDHRAWTDQMARMSGAMVIGGVGILILVLSATIMCVIFATRAAMAGNRDVVDVLHFVGASHGFIASQFQSHFLMLGMRGGLIGGVTAILIFLCLQVWVSAQSADANAAQIQALVGSPALGLYGYAGCSIVVFLIAFLTAATSRITVRRFLKSL